MKDYLIGASFLIFLGGLLADLDFVWVLAGFAVFVALPVIAERVFKYFIERSAKNKLEQAYGVWAHMGPFQSGLESATAMRSALIAVWGPTFEFSEETHDQQFEANRPHWDVLREKHFNLPKDAEFSHHLKTAQSIWQTANLNALFMEERYRLNYSENGTGLVVVSVVDTWPERQSPTALNSEVIEPNYGKIGDALFEDVSDEAKRLVDFIDEFALTAYGKITESPEELGKRYAAALELSWRKPGSNFSQAFFSVEFDWMDYLEERERTHGLRWSDLPGTYELHLRRRMNNELFRPGRQLVSQALVDSSIEIDARDFQSYAAKGATIMVEQHAIVARNQEGTLTSGELISQIRRIDTLLEEIIALGPLAQEKTTALHQLRAFIVKTVKLTLGPDKLQQFLKAEEFVASSSEFTLNPFLCMSSRPESPIPNDEYVATLMMQPYSVITAYLKGLDEGTQEFCKQQAALALAEAEPKGFKLGEKVRLAFGLK